MLRDWDSEGSTCNPRPPPPYKYKSKSPNKKCRKWAVDRWQHRARVSHLRLCGTSGNAPRDAGMREETFKKVPQNLQVLIGYN